MALTSKNLNTGHLQGIMVGEVYSPRGGIALVTVKVKGDLPETETKNRKTNFIQIAAYDDLAEELRQNAVAGQILYARYRLTTGGKKDENGVSQFFNNRTADQIVLGPVLGEEKRSVPYLNKGYFQGELAGLKRVYGSDEELWSLLLSETLLHDSGREIRHIHRFLLKRDDLKFSAGKKKTGDSVLVQYRVESRKEEKDGQTEHFTDYILTDLI